MPGKIFTPKQMAWLRLSLLTASIGIAASQITATPAQAAAGNCCDDCGCDSGFDGCCVLENGAVCLRS